MVSGNGWQLRTEEESLLHAGQKAERNFRFQLNLNLKDNWQSAISILFEVPLIGAFFISSYFQLKLSAISLIPSCTKKDNILTELLTLLPSHQMIK